MLFTIAIPTYNNANILPKAIESAINQDYQEEYEILIVNNSSTDNTLEVIKHYQTNTNVRVINNPETVELLENHNVCLKEAVGEYVLFLHSDDELCENALTVLKDRLRLRLYPKRYILWGHTPLSDYQYAIVKGGQNLNMIISGENAHRCFLHMGGVSPSGTLYSRKSLLEIGAFPPAKSPLTPHDWYIMIWASFNFFEIEMMDRLILRRTFSTTSKTARSPKHTDEVNLEMFDVLLNRLNDSQRQKFLSSVLNFGPPYLINLLKDNFTKPQLLKARLRNFKRHLLSI